MRTACQSRPRFGCVNALSALQHFPRVRAAANPTLKEPDHEEHHPRPQSRNLQRFGSRGAAAAHERRRPARVGLRRQDAAREHREHILPQPGRRARSTPAASGWLNRRRNATRVGWRLSGPPVLAFEGHPFKGHANMKFIAVFIFVLALTGCAGFSGRGLVPGQSSAEEVEALMGPAADTRQGPGGETVRYYSRLPYGREMYAARIGSDGKLRALEQRLTDDNVAKLRPGVARAHEVRDLIGPPYRVDTFWRLPPAASTPHLPGSPPPPHPPHPPPPPAPPPPHPPPPPPPP